MGLACFIKPAVESNTAEPITYGMSEYYAKAEHTVTLSMLAVGLVGAVAGNAARRRVLLMDGGYVSKSGNKGC